MSFLPPWMTNGSVVNGAASLITFLVINTNSMAHWFVPGLADIPIHGLETHCLFNFLFQPAPRVVAQARIFTSMLGYSEGDPYA